MATQAKTLEELIRELPPHMQAEVRDFVEFLLARQGPIQHVEGIRLPRSRPISIQYVEGTRQESFEQLFGSWDSGDENSADNGRIDADLAREYADPHESEI